MARLLSGRKFVQAAVDIGCSALPNPVNAMQVGQSAEVSVHAKTIWNDTGIQLERQQTYRFEVAHSERWLDSSILCGAEGFTSPNRYVGMWEWARRAPNSRWFLLMGSIQKGPVFEIGVDLIKRIADSGTLFCYANDVIAMYWNNRGSIKLKITRTQ